MTFNNQTRKEIEETEIIKKTEKFISELSFQHKSPALFILPENKNSILKKIRHLYPMLSLQNVFNNDDLTSFLSKTKKALSLYNTDVSKDNNINTESIELVAELKIDGVSFSALYENGSLIHVATRGDGTVGEDVTENTKTITNFPIKINIQDKIEVRGEIYITKKQFEILSKMSKDGFSNPRNLASGSLRVINTEISKLRDLKYFAYHIYGLEYITSQEAILKTLEDMNFCVNEKRIVCSNIEDILNFYSDIEKKRDALPYEIDGLVYKVNNIDLQNKLGNLSTIPRWAVAHKFPEIEVQTELIKISISVGRKGIITPVAELKPVMLGGVIIKRASLHNKDEILRKDIREGDIVKLKRAGEVIPKIVEVVIQKRNPSSKEFIFPEKCPSCNSNLITLNTTVAIKCPNTTGCPAMLVEKLVHFTSRDALNIDGLGEKQIKILFEKNIVQNLSNIFLIKDFKEFLLNLDGWGEKSFSNIINNIEKAKNISLDKFIFSLGIDHIGKSNSILIAEQCINIQSFEQIIKNINTNFDTENNISNIVGIGEKAIQSIKEFASDKNNIITLENLINILHIGDYTKDNIFSSPSTNIDSSTVPILTGKTIVFTGVLEMERSKAQLIAQTFGATVTNTITKKVDILICGKKSGSKIKKAQELGIEIWDEEKWDKVITTQ